MSLTNRNNAVARALNESRLSTEYSTPYSIVSKTLRGQNSKARSTVVDLLVELYGLHTMDAETVARSAADLAQLKEAARNPRSRRFGRLEIQVIEFDVVTWKVLPSLENIRFEGERAWHPKDALRYEALGNGMPVLVLHCESKERALSSLREQTAQIWRTNPHSKSIPMRGIEVPGLLAITRLAVGDGKVVGVLDATDGFSRTVGAHKGLGIDAEDVIFGLTDEAAEMRFRNELIELRDSGKGDLGDDQANVIACQLRTSVMPRAQVIVGYQWLDPEFSEETASRFDFARRALVGHVHLEPALRFSDSTEFALKGKIALEALQSAGNFPVVDGMTSIELQALLTDAEGNENSDPDSLRESMLWPDEVAVVAIESLLNGGGTPDRVRTVNRAISALTGKAPSRLDRALLAADTAMRVTSLSNNQTEADAAFKGKRSTLGRALQSRSLANAHLSGRPIQELRDEAIAHMRKQRDDLVEFTVPRSAAELGALALFDMVVGPTAPLLIRSGAKDEGGKYIPEPPKVIEGLLHSESGIQQLAQIVHDVRARRAPKKVPAGYVSSAGVHEDWAKLTREDLLELADGIARSEDLSMIQDASRALQVGTEQLRESIEKTKSLIDFVGRIVGADGKELILKEGCDLEREVKMLDEASYASRKWTEIMQVREREAKASLSFEDALDYDDDADSTDDEDRDIQDDESVA